MSNTQVGKLGDLTPNPKNPRRITDKKLEMLKRALDEFGDLGCIVENETTGNLCGGHQRVKVLSPDSDIIITQSYDTPTRTGTVAEGHVLIAGEKFKFRRVRWDETKEKAALLAANKHGGEFDFVVLNDVMLELDQVNFDMDLTGFDSIEIENQMTYVNEHDDDSIPDQDEKEISEPAQIQESTEQKQARLERIVIPEIMEGDCLEVLKTIPCDHADSLVTDPPAGIAFMGKEWDEDKGGSKEWIAWLSSVMREALRVMKPGAHGLVWAIPRTSHWTATALEDAGFEIRDVVTHLFGSGFPKSMDISKAIDKAAGAEREVVGVRKQPDITNNRNGDKTEDRIGSNTIDGQVKYREIQDTAPSTDDAKQWQGWGTALKPASEHWILVRKKPIIAECEEIVLNVEKNIQHTKRGLKEVEDLLAPMLVGLAEDQREKTIQLGVAVDGLDMTAMSLLGTLVTSPNIDLNIVSSWKNISDEDLKKVKTFTTLMALRQTTELKTLNFSRSENTQRGTSSEHFILVRKPLSEKTVAANVLKYGTGGINIDASRIAACDQEKLAKNWDRETITDIRGNKYASETQPGTLDNSWSAPQGRFPANLVLSHNDDCVNGTETVAAWECSEGCAVAELDRHSGVSKSVAPKKSDNRLVEKAGDSLQLGKAGVHNPDNSYSDTGGASRFFYCAKASKRERNDGCAEELKEKQGARPNSKDMSGKFPDHDHRPSGGNNHPTVKPIKLMSYLITMITPPNGLVLDPFTGSGTTGVAAGRLGFKFLGIEQNPDYVQIARHRFVHEMSLNDDDIEADSFEPELDEDE